MQFRLLWLNVSIDGTNTAPNIISSFECLEIGSTLGIMSRVNFQRCTIQRLKIIATAHGYNDADVALV